jgi:hypothetical protein
METKTRVFLNVPAVTSRIGGPLRWKAQLVSRGNGTVMYVSRPADTHEAAEQMARRFLTTPRGSRLELS